MITLLIMVAFGNQAAVPVTLPDALRAHVTSEPFQIVTSIRGLPLGVRDRLETLFGSGGLDIAEPGADFQATDVVVDPRLKSRRLVRAGCSMDHCLVYYERGGKVRTWYLALFHWTPEATRVECGGLVEGNLASVEDLRRIVLSGAIKGPVKAW